MLCQEYLYRFVIYLWKRWPIVLVLQTELEASELGSASILRVLLLNMCNVLCGVNPAMQLIANCDG